MTSSIKGPTAADATLLERLTLNLGHAIEIIDKHVSEEALGYNYEGDGEVHGGLRSWPYKDEYLHYMRETLEQATRTATIRASEGDAEQAGWAWLNTYAQQRHGEHPADIDFSADQMVDAFIAGMEAALTAKPYSERLVEALQRISALRPSHANAGTAMDLHLTVKAIADSALADHGGSDAA